MVLSREAEIYRRDAAQDGTLLTPSDREALVKPYLSSLDEVASLQTRVAKTRPVRTYLKLQLHLLLHVLIHACFSLLRYLRYLFSAIYARILATLYHHHRTPELIRRDLRFMRQMPQHMSFIVNLQAHERDRGLNLLLDDVAEISTWCACAGIPLVSIYEKTGVLKRYMPTTHRRVVRRMTAYFGTRRPSLQIEAPHVSSLLDDDANGDGESSERVGSAGHLTLLLLSSTDGRDTLVDLTKTLAEMSQHGKLSPSDISQELIDVEMRESVMGEPDLLLMFGDQVVLQGYPPWQLRLTEIFNGWNPQAKVEYAVWVRALRAWGGVERRFGR